MTLHHPRIDNPLLTGLPSRVSLADPSVVAPLTDGRRPVHARGRHLPP